MGCARRPRRSPLNAPTFAIPVTCPAGLEPAVETRTLYRLEATPFGDWSWDPHPKARYRFDSASGAHRVRYAATTPHGAGRERYRDTGNRIPSDHADQQWTELSGELALLDLRADSTLDALGFDARICTAYEDHVIAACHQLTDSVLAWWGPDIHGLVYTSRTTPEGSANVAFFEQAPLTGASSTLSERSDVLEEFIVIGGLQVAFDF